MPDWSELFGLDAPLLETFLRGTVVFLAIFVLMRVIGQRERVASAGECFGAS